MVCGRMLGRCQGSNVVSPAHRAPSTTRSMPRHQQWWGTCQQHNPPGTRASAFSPGHSPMDDLHGGDQLASEFAAHIGQLSLKAPLQHRRPSPLDPPTATVAAQMDALQINDWPELDAGVHTALAFAKPYQCEQLVAAAQLPGALEAPSTVPLPAPSFGQKRGTGSSTVQGPGQNSSSSSSGHNSNGARHSSNSDAHHSKSSHGSNDTSPSSSSSSNSGDGNDSSGVSSGEQLVRSWSAREAWLTPQQFAAELHSSTYAPLLGCDSWRACSSIVFPPTRAGNRAVQAVEVLAHRSDSSSPSSPRTGSSSSGSSSGGQQPLHRFTYTFVLERIASGPYRGCWLTIGVRPGNYAL